MFWEKSVADAHRICEIVELFVSFDENVTAIGTLYQISQMLRQKVNSSIL